MSLRVLYEDDALIAIDKPSGWVVHHGWTRDAPACLQAVRDLVGAHVHPVHRLDRGASGVLVFAKSPAVAATLGDAFASGATEKTYLALVRGHSPAAGEVDEPVPEDEGGARVPARSRYRTLETVTIDSPLRERRYSLVAVTPETGRFHQIRRHLKHLGHPLIGDANYGRSEHNRLWRDRFALDRLALHALRLDVPHPTNAQPLMLEAPLPAAFAQSLRSAGFAAR